MIQPIRATSIQNSTNFAGKTNNNSATNSIKAQQNCCPREKLNIDCNEVRSVQTLTRDGAVAGKKLDILA